MEEYNINVEMLYSSESTLKFVTIFHESLKFAYLAK